MFRLIAAACAGAGTIAGVAKLKARPMQANKKRGINVLHINALLVTSFVIGCVVKNGKCLPPSLGHTAHALDSVRMTLLRRRLSLR